MNLAGHWVFHLLINDVIDRLVEFKRRMALVSRTWPTSAYVVDQASRRGTKACHYLTASVDQSGCPPGTGVPLRTVSTEAFGEFQYPTPPAGTSASGFRAEVESEQALARGQGLLGMIEGHEHHDLAGPAAEEAERRLQEFGEQAGFQGTVVLDERRWKRIMKRHDPAVYPGDCITCVHDPAKALCERAKRGRAEDMPQHGGCRPLACRNVALTTANTAAWTRELDRIEHQLSARPPAAAAAAGRPAAHTARGDHRVPPRQRPAGGTAMTTVPEALVRKKLEQLLAACEQQNRRPSVLALVRQVGMSNTTFRRNYPDITREIGLRR